MKCQNCSTIANPGESFCKVCGTSLTSQPINIQPQQSVNQPMYNQPQQPVNQPMYNQPQQPVNQPMYNQPQYNNDDEALLDAFIGPNAYQLKNNSFSLYTFLFGSLYTLYRKMWLLSLIWIVGSSIATSFLGGFAGLISLAATIYLSIEFKKLYIKNAREEIAKIKYQYPNVSREQLMLILRQKGGTSIWPVVVTGVIMVAIIFVILAPFILATLSEL